MLGGQENAGPHCGGHRGLCPGCGFLSRSKQAHGCAWRGSNPALALHPEMACGDQRGILVALLHPIAVLCSLKGMLPWQGCLLHPRVLGTPGLCWVPWPPTLPFLPARAGRTKPRFLPAQRWRSWGICGEKSPPHPAAAAGSFDIPREPPSPTSLPYHMRLNSKSLLGCTVPAPLAPLVSSSPCRGANAGLPLLRCRQGVPTELPRTLWGQSHWHPMMGI